eukprot:8629082-Pyramimonas_sp.AAC.1
MAVSTSERSSRLLPCVSNRRLVLRRSVIPCCNHTHPSPMRTSSSSLLFGGRLSISNNSMVSEKTSQDWSRIPQFNAISSWSALRSASSATARATAQSIGWGVGPVGNSTGSF